MTSDGSRAITYDYDNMPRSINGRALNFVYDGLETRVKKVVTSPSTYTVTYIDKLYECTSGSGCGKYIFVGDDRIALKNSSGVFYYHPDQLGSTAVVTDAAGYKVEGDFYSPFGETSAYPVSPFTGVKHKYTSQEMDGESGLYNYNARLYNPGTGRFISADSIVPDPTDPQSLNRYSYVRSNPINATDPTGHYDDWGLPLIIWGDSGNSWSWSWSWSWSGNGSSGSSWGSSGSSSGNYSAPTANPLGNGTTNFSNSLANTQSYLSYGQEGIGVNSTLKFGTPSDQAYSSYARQWLNDQVDDYIDHYWERTGNALIGMGITPLKSGVPLANFVPKSGITKAYVRPKFARATVVAQRNSVQGQPCVDCGVITNKQVADHIVPLSVQHFSEGAVNVEQQSLVPAVQPHCPTCSAIQGGQLRAFVRKMKVLLGLGP